MGENQVNFGGNMVCRLKERRLKPPFSSPRRAKLADFSAVLAHSTKGVCYRIFGNCGCLEIEFQPLFTEFAWFQAGVKN